MLSGHIIRHLTNQETDDSGIKVDDSKPSFTNGVPRPEKLEAPKPSASSSAPVPAPRKSTGAAPIPRPSSGKQQMIKIHCLSLLHDKRRHCKKHQA